MSTLETETALATIPSQDPFPESNWGPRRRFTFGSQIAAGLLISLAIMQKAPASVSIALVVYCVANSIFYLVAPSAEQVAKMFASLGALKSGIGFSSSSAIDVPAGRIESEASATPALSPDAKPED